MNCNHDALRETDQAERREMLLSGNPKIDCPDCGDTFKLEEDHHAGEIYLVRWEKIDCECGHMSTGTTRPDVEINHLTHYLNDHDDLEEWQEEAAKEQLEWAREQASAEST